MMMPPIKIVSDEEAETVDVVVCVREGTPTRFTDNVSAICAWCGHAIFHRPHAPARAAEGLLGVPAGTVHGRIRMMRALTMLNQAGDTTIVWEAERDAEMEEIIARKMKAGVTFFIVEPRLEGRAPPTKTPLKKASEARKHRALAIPDEDFAKFVDSGAGEAVPTPPSPVKRPRVSRDPKEVARSQSVGVAQMRGG